MESEYTWLRKKYLAEWNIWYRMHQRCRKEKYYVEVEIYEDWHGPQGFINWFDYVGPRLDPKWVLNRPNKLGDFAPGNMLWSTREEAYKDVVFGQRPDTSEFFKWKKVARANGIHPKTYENRVRKYGWTMEDAANMIPATQKYKNRLL